MNNVKEWLSEHGNDLAEWQGGIPLYRWLSDLDEDTPMSSVWDSCTGTLSLIVMLEVENKGDYATGSVGLCRAFAEYASRYVSKMTGDTEPIFKYIESCGNGELTLYDLTHTVVTSATANQWRLRYQKTEEEGPAKMRQLKGRTLSCAIEKVCYLEWYDAFSIILQLSYDRYGDDRELACLVRKYVNNPW